MIFNVKTIKMPVDLAHKDLHTLEFNLILPGCEPFVPQPATFGPAKESQIVDKTRIWKFSNFGH